jgi:hypothetical protein
MLLPLNFERSQTMSMYAKFAAEAGDQYLEAMGQTQDNFLNAIAISKTWAPAIPVEPDFPTPQEIIDVSFGFTQKLLKQQQDFVERLIASSETRTEPANVKSAPPPKSKSAAN